MDVSVVIPVLNGAVVIGEQLEALAAQETDLEWEVVIADNGSTDGTRKIVESWRDRHALRVSVVDASSHRSISHARNRGAAHALGEVLAFCDCDDRVAGDWVHQAWLATREADLVGGVLRELRDPFDPDSTARNPEGLIGKRAKSVLGSNFAVRRRVYEAVGGFDESLPPYGCEDIEFGMRVGNAGYRLRGAPAMIVYFRPTVDFRTIVRKTFSSGQAEAFVWKRLALTYPEIPQSIPAACWNVLRWPADAARTMMAGGSSKGAARLLLTRLGNVKGMHEISRNPLGEPRYLNSEAASTDVFSTVLWVIPVSNLAGVARHAIDVARVGLPGWRMVVLAPEGPLLDKLRELNCAVIAAPIDEASVPKAVALVRDAVRRVRPEVVHSHLAKADILVTLATAGMPVKLVTTEHHVPPERLMFHDTLAKAVVMENVHRVRLTRFAQAIAVSASTKRDMLRWWKTKTPITVILNAVDRPDPAPVRQPGLRLLSLCRLSPEKDVAATLRAFKIVHDEHPEARLTVAGSGPESEALQRQARELGIADAVSFPGFVDPVATMAEHDVIMQPSRSDNLSYTLLDALAQGMGIAASPIGGNPEILPERCIADFGDDAALARITIEQGLNLIGRPSLPGAVPTVTEMTARIAGVYREARR